MFELHYGRGGHGGPYPTLDAALDAARIHVKVEGTVAVRHGVGGALEAVVTTRRPAGLIAHDDATFTFYAPAYGIDNYPGCARGA